MASTEVKQKLQEFLLSKSKDPAANGNNHSLGRHPKLWYMWVEFDMRSSVDLQWLVGDSSVLNIKKLCLYSIPIKKLTNFSTTALKLKGMPRTIPKANVKI